MGAWRQLQGGAGVGNTKRGKGSKIMAIADRQGLPVAVHLESATPHEVTLVHATLAERFVKELNVRLIGDNAYESDRLDADPDSSDSRRPPRCVVIGAVEDRATLCLVSELSADRPSDFSLIR
jgi:hypothetical protein